MGVESKPKLKLSADRVTQLSYFLTMTNSGSMYNFTRVDSVRKDAFGGSFYIVLAMGANYFYEEYALEDDRDADFEAISGLINYGDI